MRKIVRRISIILVMLLLNCFPTTPGIAQTAEASWSFENTILVWGTVAETKDFTPNDFPSVDCTDVIMIHESREGTNTYYELILVLSQSGKQFRTQAIERVKSLSFVEGATENEYADFNLVVDQSPLVLKVGETLSFDYTQGGNRHEWEETLKVTLEVDPTVYNEDLFAPETFSAFGITEYWPKTGEGDWISKPFPMVGSLKSEQHRYCTTLIMDETNACFNYLDMLLRADGITGVQIFVTGKIGVASGFSIANDTPELYRVEEQRDSVTLSGLSSGEGELTFCVGEEVKARREIIVYQPGDVNGDRNVDARDALQILQKAVGEIDLKTYQMYAADVNDDETINAQDALRVLQVAVGK